MAFAWALEIGESNISGDPQGSKVDGKFTLFAFFSFSLNVFNSHHLN